jgi:hypothetical protein
MGRFADAIIKLSSQEMLERKHNYLCNLLDEGYSVEGLIGSNIIKLNINVQDGIKITNDGDNIFSIDPATGQIVIGKYDNEIAALEADLGTAYNDIAQQLGYDDYDDMVAEAIAGHTIINGGYLRAELIQSNTILFNQLASSAVTSINNEIDLGGRNLLRGTELQCFIGWGNGTVSYTAGYPTYLTKVTRTGTGAAYGTGAHANYRFMQLEANRQYNLSFEVRGIVGCILDYVYAMDASSGNVRIGTTVATITSETIWQTVSVTFTRPTASTVGHVLIGAAAGVVNDWFEIRNVKIEQGNKATAWTPNTDDQVSQLITYQGVQIDAANGFVSTATIGGKTAKVKLNSVDGLAFYDGAAKQGGLSVINNKLVLTVDVLANNSDVLNFVTFEPYYTYASQTFSGTQYWTDDADASPVPVQHLLIMGDVNKAAATSQTIINAVALNDAGSVLNYETNLKVGSFVPTQVGDGNYGYIEFIGKTSGGNGSVILGAGNSDGSAYFNAILNYNEFSIWNATTELLEVTSSGLKILGNYAFHNGAASITDAAVITVNINNGLHTRSTSSGSSGFATTYGQAWYYAGATWGRDFAIFKTSEYDRWFLASVNSSRNGFGTWNEIWHTGNDGTGSGLDADTLDTYHASAFLKLSGGTMTGDINMGSNNIVGNTTGCYITAERIGLGVAANSSYRVDAGTGGYIRAGKFYAGTQGGITMTFKAQDMSGNYYAFDIAGGIIVDASLLP